MKIFLISEVISFPFDEGFKNMVYYLIKNIRDKENMHIITKNGNNTNGLNVEKIKLNKLFFNNKLRVLLKSYSPDVILYIPEASCTFNSFVRAKILKLMTEKAKVAILGVQHREYLFFYRMLLSFLRPDLLFLLSKSDKFFFEKKGMNVKVLPPAVDKKKFYEVENETKVALRKKYGILVDKVIVLHVGHINTNRNIECFINVQRISEIQVVIVGSTTTQIDKRLKCKLENHGVIIIDNYLPETQEIYQLSDIYVFPAIKQNSSIEMPLSVIEAMACNIPVITTRFGGLVDYFNEDIGFRYFNTSEELVELVKNMNINEVHNCKKVERFTWDNFANKVISTCEEIL